MMGLLSSMYNNYRIRDNTDAAKKQHEGFRGAPAQYASFPARGTYMIVAILLTILTILCLIDIYMVKGFSAWMLILLILLLLTPFLGDILAIAVIIYWVVECRPQSQILGKLGIQ